MALAIAVVSAFRRTSAGSSASAGNGPPGSDKQPPHGESDAGGCNPTRYIAGRGARYWNLRGRRTSLASRVGPSVSQR